MNIRNLITPLAVAAVLSLSSGASAQVMIDDFVVPEEDVGAFAQKCQALQAALNQSLTINEESIDDTTTGSIGASSPDPAALENQSEVIAKLTVEQCREAGLL